MKVTQSEAREALKQMNKEFSLKLCVPLSLKEG